MLNGLCYFICTKLKFIPLLDSKLIITKRTNNTICLPEIHEVISSNNIDKCTSR